MRRNVFTCNTLVFATVLLSTAAPVRAADAPSLTAAELLAKHYAFVGWSANDATMPTLKTEFSSGKAGDSDITVSRGTRYRDVDTSDGGSTVNVTGFNGHAYWKANDNGNVVTVEGEAARSEASWNSVWLETTNDLPGTLRGSATVGGVATSIVRVTPAGGNVMDLYVDPATGAYLRVMIAVGTPQEYAVEIDRYDEVAPGKKVLASYHSSARRRNELKHAEFAISVPDSDLNPSKPATSWTFASTEPMPIAIREHSQPVGPGGKAVVVKATVDGHEGVFQLDSGAGVILLYSHFADALGATAVAKTAIGGVNGRAMSARRVRIDDFAFGSNVLHHVLVDVVPGGDDFKVDGLIGYDFFAQALVDIDLDQKQMTILDPARFAPAIAPRAYAFPIDLTAFTPAVAVTIDGKVTAHLTIDSGNDGSVTISDALHRSGKVIGNETQSTFFIKGVDGTSASAVTCANVSEFKLGAFRFTNERTCFLSSRVFGDDGGLLGFDFLQHFNWTFDYPEGHLVLTPNSFR